MRTIIITAAAALAGLAWFSNDAGAQMGGGGMGGSGMGGPTANKSSGAKNTNVVPHKGVRAPQPKSSKDTTSRPPSKPGKGKGKGMGGGGFQGPG